MKLPPQIVGNAGLFYVCHKLSALGWNAMPTSRNAAGVDVMCFSLGGTNKLLIQVKSLQKPDSLFMPNPDKIMGDYWVVVLGATGEKPTCYILTLAQVKSLVYTYTAKKDGKITYWLPVKRYAVDEFREQWEQIGPGC